MSEPGEAGNVESWFAREHHSCPHDRLLAWVEPRWFMAIDSNAVASMVAKSAGQTGRLNRLPSCRVDQGTSNAGLERSQCGVLSPQHDFEVFLLSRPGFPNNNGPFELAGVSSDFNTGLSNQYIPSPDLPLREDRMWHRRPWSDLSPTPHNYRRKVPLQLLISSSKFLHHSCQRLVARLQSNYRITLSRCDVFN